MSLEEIREQNKQLVTAKALELFIRNGIANTRVADIAHASGLTQRSVFRYYPTKNEIIIAAADLFWDHIRSHVTREAEKQIVPGMTGIEEIRVILNAYARTVLVEPDGIRFSMECEMALYQCGEEDRVIDRPPEPFETYRNPLSVAIRKGLKDGTVNKNAEIKTLYYNAYDSILGMIQRISVGVPSTREIATEERLQYICEMYVQKFAAKPSDGSN